VPRSQHVVNHADLFFAQSSTLLFISLDFIRFVLELNLIWRYMWCAWKGENLHHKYCNFLNYLLLRICIMRNYLIIAASIRTGNPVRTEVNRTTRFSTKVRNALNFFRRGTFAENPPQIRSRSAGAAACRYGYPVNSYSRINLDRGHSSSRGRP
jgi:hypothetical protein